MQPYFQRRWHKPYAPRTVRQMTAAAPCIRCGNPSHPCYGARCEDCWAFMQFIYHGRHQLTHIISEGPQEPMPEDADNRHEKRRI